MATDFPKIAARYHFCIVDDDVAAGESLCELLDSYGLTASCFNSADEFLDRASLPSESILILDVYMPKMGGRELLSLLRSRGINCPAIFVTASALQPLEQDIRRLGGAGLLAKPLKLSELAPIVAAIAMAE